MPKKKWIGKAERLAERPVFSTSSMVARGVPRSYVARLGNYLVEEKGFTRVERGKFTNETDPLLVAPFVVFPSYLSMATALQLHGLLQQVPHRIDVVTTRKRNKREMKILGSPVKFFRVKKALFFGYRQVNHEGQQIPVADPEKALVDLAYFAREPAGELDLSGLDRERLDGYLELVGKGAVCERVGRWLDASIQ